MLEVTVKSDKSFTKNCHKLKKNQFWAVLVFTDSCY